MCKTIMYISIFFWGLSILETLYIHISDILESRRSKASRRLKSWLRQRWSWKSQKCSSKWFGEHFAIFGHRRILLDHSSWFENYQDAFQDFYCSQDYAYPCLLKWSKYSNPNLNFSKTKIWSIFMFFRFLNLQDFFLFWLVWE